MIMYFVFLEEPSRLFFKRKITVSECVEVMKKSIELCLDSNKKLKVKATNIPLTSFMTVTAIMMTIMIMSVGGDNCESGETHS